MGTKFKGYDQLKRDLHDNIKSRGLIEKVYADKVDEYMDLWQRRKELEADIDARGIVVLDERRGMLIENRSVSLEVQVSRQMLSIYKSLGFESSATAISDNYDDDEL